MNMISKDWKKEDVEELIKDGVEENLSLEYKSCGALGKTDEKKKEISKDVSSFANSDGGVIIYGLKEYDQEGKKHLPEKIEEGFDPADISKEWLEQVIVSNIRPKINNLLIYPIPTGVGSKVIYIVEIPRGETACQSKDYRYYKRNNFQSVPMEDYEVRDVMNRKKVPDVELVFAQRRLPSSDKNEYVFELHVSLINRSEIVIRYFRVEISLPLDLVTHQEGYSQREEFHKVFGFKGGPLPPKGVNYRKFSYNNPSNGSVIFPNEEFILLPSVVSPVRTLVYKWVDDVGIYAYSLIWKIYADNMPCKEGSIDLERIENKRMNISV